jgi:hypothetical protein
VLADPVPCADITSSSKRRDTLQKGHSRSLQTRGPWRASLTGHLNEKLIVAEEYFGLWEGQWKKAMRNF